MKAFEQRLLNSNGDEQPTADEFKPDSTTKHFVRASELYEPATRSRKELWGVRIA